MNVSVARQSTPWLAAVIAASLVTLSVSELLVQIGGVDGASTAGRGAFLVMCILIAPRFAMREWALVVMAVLLTVGLLTRPDGVADVVFALDRAAFFAAFITLVTLLKEAAQRSPSVLRLGEYFTRQPPGRRYYALAGGGHAMGVLLNFGAISLLTPLILRGARATSDDPAAIAALDRQQLSALIRGFAWMIMWSPTALTQAVLFASFPSVHMPLVAALGIGASVVMIWLGRLEGRQRSGELLPDVERPSMALPTGAAIRFATICTVVICFTFITMRVVDVSAALGLMMVAPIVTVAWIFEQEWVRDFGRTSRNTASSVVEIIGASAHGLARSAFTLGAAGFVGEAAARLLPVSRLAELIGTNAVPDWLFLMALPVLITLGGQVALSPILIVVFLSAVINQLPSLPADPNLIVFALGAGWAMSMTASPNASATLLISGVTGVAPTTLTWRWNGRYALICYAVFSLSFILLAQVFPT
ncbi:hypothetical protein N9H93_04625 [Rhizobiaceae bacterium]|nr:hypothetical protein [Rhizobiaceae bacterium]